MLKPRSSHSWLALLLGVAILFSAIFPTVFAETGVPAQPQNCALTEDCALEAGHEGNCMSAETPAESEAASTSESLSEESSETPEDVAPEASPADTPEALAEPAPAASLEGAPEALPEEGSVEDASVGAPQPALLSGTGDSAEDPMEVPAEGMVIVGGVYYGVSLDWFKTVSSGADDTLYFSITVPSGVTTITTDGFRDSYSSEKTKQGAVTYNDNAGRYNVVAIDFSGASDLTTIKSQAAMGCQLSGVLDLSATKITTLEKSAFNGCSGLTGVILPSTLEVLGAADGSSGSVFSGCTGLQFVRTAGGDPTADFELPAGLRVIGRQTFKNTFAKGADLKIRIPASVEIVGSEAFYSNSCFSQIVIERTGSLDGYDSGAFKAAATADCLLILPNSDAYNSTGSFTRVTKTYPVTLVFDNGQSIVAEQKKLFGQSIQYTLDEATGHWNIDSAYTLPDTGDVGSTPGYDAGWMLYGSTSVLTNTSKVTGWPDDTLKVTIKTDSALSKPTVKFTVNGNVVEDSQSGVQKLSVTVDETAPGTVGVQVTHPLATEEARASGTYVYFKYCWWDEVDNSVNGPRSQEQPELFSSSENSATYDRVFTDAASISIRDRMDERTDGNYYLVEVYGYYVENNGPAKQFYKSDHNFIAGQDGTAAEAFVMEVEVTDTTPVVITPADITIYTGGSGHYGVVDGSGSIDDEYTGNGFPEPGYYITLPSSLNELVGGADNAVNLADQLTLRYDDHNGTTREWKLALYGTAENSTDVEVDGQTRARYIYKLLPSTEQQIPVRVQILDPETGETILSDDFTPSMEEKYKEYDMTIYPGALSQNFVSAELVVGNDTYVCPVSVQPGKLTVRGLNDEVTTDIVTGETAVPGSITASAPEDVTYFVNGSHVEVAEPEHVKLLVDTVLNEDVLTDYIEANLMDEDVDHEVGYEQRYLDLVDTKNGNVFLTMGSGQQMTIYWPVPDDYVEGGAVSVYHFEALDRNYDASVDKMLENHPPQEIVPTLTTIDGQDYFKFDTGSFSPFVLAYEKTPTTYTLTVENGSGSGQYEAGTQVAIAANAAPAGKVFDRWVTSGGGSFASANSASTTFTMPADAVTVTALYKNAPSGGGSDGGSGSGGSGSPAGPAQSTGMSTGQVPQTGDTCAPLLWLALLAAAGAGLLAVFALKRRDRS